MRRLTAIGRKAANLYYTIVSFCITEGRNENTEDAEGLKHEKTKLVCG